LLQIVCENKRIHIDLCRNDRGEFFKLSEIDQTGKRSKVFFPVSGARIMADTFDEFAECDEGYGDTAPAPVLDAEGYPQVGCRFIPSWYYLKHCGSRSNQRLSPSKTNDSFAICAPTIAVDFSSSY
jgi:hypothetical protein